jgi:hypothetical protein
MAKRKSFKRYTAALAITGVLTLSLAISDNEFNFLETSFLNILKNITEDNVPELPDLSIEKVTVRKVGDPSEDFNYYKYYANIVIKNHGGILKNATVVLGGNNQKSIYVSNSEDGLNLDTGGSYIVDHYELIFDGDYNGGDIDIEIEVRDRKDSDKDNNLETVSVFEGPAKIQAIAVKDLMSNGNIVLDYYPENFSLNLDDYEIVYTENLTSLEDEKYDELPSEEGIFGYHRIKIDGDTIEGNDWAVKENTELGAHYLDLYANPHKPDKTIYSFVRAVNADTGTYAVSNIVKFSPQEDLTRGAFAKHFVDFAEISEHKSTKAAYSDIDIDSWYGPAVQTLYNLGLTESLKDDYNPDLVMTRGEAMRVLVDYCDFDLSFPEEQSFSDISFEHYLYPYIEALYSNGKGRIFRDFFNPDEAATKNYLKYIVDECQKNS